MSPLLTIPFFSFFIRYTVILFALDLFLLTDFISSDYDFGYHEIENQLGASIWFMCKENSFSLILPELRTV